MKTVKQFLIIPALALIMMSFSQCSSAQFDKKAPATITESFYQDWVGGRPGSKGTLVTIKMQAPEKEMVFDSIYFNGKTVKLGKSINENEITLTGNFMIITKPNDLIMHADPKEEFGNKAPQVTKKIPFELQKDEAVVSYIIKNKKRYFKLSGIKKMKTLFYQ